MARVPPAFRILQGTAITLVGSPGVTHGTFSVLVLRCPALTAIWFADRTATTIASSGYFTILDSILDCNLLLITPFLDFPQFATGLCKWADHLGFWTFTGFCKWADHLDHLDFFGTTTTILRSILNFACLFFGFCTGQTVVHLVAGFCGGLTPDFSALNLDSCIDKVCSFLFIGTPCNAWHLCHLVSASEPITWIEIFNFLLQFLTILGWAPIHWLAQRYTWMCSVILILALIIVSYIVATDFVNLHPVALVANYNGDSDTKKGAEKGPCKGEILLVPTPQRFEGPLLGSTASDQASTVTPSFQGPNVHCGTVKGNGSTNIGTMEMPPLQKDLLWPARILCAMRATLEVLYGPRFCAPSAKAPTTFSAMDIESMGCRRRLGNASMDSVTSKATVPKEAIKAPSSSCASQQRQRTRKTIGGATKLWTTMVASFAIVGTPMVDSYDCSYGHQLFQCLSDASSATGYEGRQGARQATQVACSGPEASERRPTRRVTDAGDRSYSPQRARRNQTSSFSSLTARPRKEASPGSPIGTPAHACRMAQFLGAISGAMVQIHGAVHAAGTPAPGQAQAGPRCLSQCQGKPWSMQVCGRTDGKGRCFHGQRCGGSRSEGLGNSSWPENSSKLSGPGYKPQVAPQASRPSGATRRRAKSAPQTTPNDSPGSRRSSECRRWQPSSFWRARVNTGTKRIAQGLPQTCAREGSHPFPFAQSFDADLTPVCTSSFFHPTLKWQHTILNEPDFMDEWTAQDKAFHLALQIAPTYVPVVTNSATTKVAETQLRSSIRGLHVRFCPDVQLYIGADDQHFFHMIQIHEKSLDMHGKPWSLHPTTSCFQPIQQTSGKHGLQSCEDNCPCACEMPSCTSGPRGKTDAPFHDASFLAPFFNCSVEPHVTPAHHERSQASVSSDWPQGSIRSNRHALHPLCSPDSAPGTCSRPSIHADASVSKHCINHANADLPRYVHTGCSSDFPVHGYVDCTDSLMMSRKPHPDSPNQIHDPLSCCKPAQFHASQNPLSLGSFNHAVKPGISQLRLEHESPIAGLPPAPHSDNEDDEDDFHQGPAGPPAFLQRLIERFSRLGMAVHDADFEIPLRTWFIDHVNMRRCTAFRILQLVGPPGFWEQQFSSLWVDLISQDDWFELTIVQPDPPRPSKHSFVRLDVIITQSLHMDRFPGLVTVMPTTIGSFDMYAVAFSFPDFVSGHDIIVAADAAHLCRYHPCTVTFGWDEIPNTLQPRHVMRPGDGFQVAVRHTPVQQEPGAEPSSSSSQVRDDTNPSVPFLIPSTPEHPWWDDPVHGRFTTPLHLFQLDAHEVTVQLVNAQLAQPSHEISAATGVPFDCLEAIHMVIDRPYEFPEMAIPAILQRTGDIPARSTDRLMLIDVVYFHHPAMATAPNRPTVVRTVHRMDYQVIRPQLLMTAAVYHYCTFLQDTCEVFLDRNPWPLADRAPRPIRHGSYARILVPPPQGYEVDTMQAAEVLHTDAQTNAMMDFLQEDIPLDDATFLQQITAQRTFAHGSTPRIRHILAPLQVPEMEQNAMEGDQISLPPSRQLTPWQMNALCRNVAALWVSIHQHHHRRLRLRSPECR